MLEGDDADILAAITIMTAAIDRYKDLCEGRCCGQAVGRVQRIMGVEFSYQVRGGGRGKGGGQGEEVKEGGTGFREGAKGRSREGAMARWWRSAVGFELEDYY